MIANPSLARTRNRPDPLDHHSPMFSAISPVFALTLSMLPMEAPSEEPALHSVGTARTWVRDPPMDPEGKPIPNLGHLPALLPSVSTSCGSWMVSATFPPDTSELNRNDQCEGAYALASTLAKGVFIEGDSQAGDTRHCDVSSEAGSSGFVSIDCAFSAPPGCVGTVEGKAHARLRAFAWADSAGLDSSAHQLGELSLTALASCRFAAHSSYSMSPETAKVATSMSGKSGNPIMITVAGVPLSITLSPPHQLPVAQQASGVLEIPHRKVTSFYMKSWGVSGAGASAKSGWLPQFGLGSSTWAAGESKGYAWAEGLTLSDTEELCGESQPGGK